MRTLQAFSTPIPLVLMCTELLWCRGCGRTNELFVWEPSADLLATIMSD